MVAKNELTTRIVFTTYEEDTGLKKRINKDDNTVPLNEIERILTDMEKNANFGIMYVLHYSFKT